jgi:hypothetical protein
MAPQTAGLTDPDDVPEVPADPVSPYWATCGCSGGIGWCAATRPTVEDVATGRSAG